MKNEHSLKPQLALLQDVLDTLTLKLFTCQAWGNGPKFQLALLWAWPWTSSMDQRKHCPRSRPALTPNLHLLKPHPTFSLLRCSSQNRRGSLAFLVFVLVWFFLLGQVIQTCYLNKQRKDIFFTWSFVSQNYSPRCCFEGLRVQYTCESCSMLSHVHL